MIVTPTLKHSSFLIAGLVARDKLFEVPTSVRSTDRAGYCEARVVPEISEPQKVGDITLAALPVGRPLSEAAISEIFLLRGTGMGAGKPFSGICGIRQLKDGRCQTIGTKSSI